MINNQEYQMRVDVKILHAFFYYLYYKQNI